jgi:hypothetical protein
LFYYFSLFVLSTKAMAFSLNTELFHVIFDNLTYIKVWIMIFILPFLSLLPDIAMKMIQTLLFPNPSDILMQNISEAKQIIANKPIPKVQTIKRIETLKSAKSIKSIKKETPLESEKNVRLEKNKNSNDVLDLNNRPDYSRLSDTMRPILNSPDKGFEENESKRDIIEYNIKKKEYNDENREERNEEQEDGDEEQEDGDEEQEDGDEEQEDGDEEQEDGDEEQEDREEDQEDGDEEEQEDRDEEVVEDYNDERSKEKMKSEEKYYSDADKINIQGELY